MSGFLCGKIRKEREFCSGRYFAATTKQSEEHDSCRVFVSSVFMECPLTAVALSKPLHEEGHEHEDYDRTG